MSPLQWYHNDRDGISIHQPHYCLFNPLFNHRWMKTSKLRVTGLCDGNSWGTGEFPAQRANNTENVSIWWHHLANFFLTASTFLYLYSCCFLEGYLLPLWERMLELLCWVPLLVRLYDMMIILITVSCSRAYVQLEYYVKINKYNLCLSPCFYVTNLSAVMTHFYRATLIFYVQISD